MTACPHLPVISYTEWCRRVYDKAANARIPLNGIIELTYRCNLACGHCYIKDHPVSRELDYQQICSVIDQISSAGCLFLLLTGGEPLLRRDFPQIYLYAKKKGLFITLFTNGTLISAETADLLAEYPPFIVEITLYGITEETYEKVTGVSGSLKRCLRGIDLLRERKIPLKLKSTLTILNKDELGQMKQFARSLDLDFRFDACINPRLDGNKEVCRLRMEPEEIVALDLADEKRSKEWRELCENYWGRPISDKRYSCAAGVTYFVISPAAELKMCAVLPAVHNIAPDDQKSFQEGWNNVIPGILTEERDRESPCSNCQIFCVCDRCAAHARMEMGEPDVPIPFFCRIARLRAEAFASGERKARLKIKGGFYADQGEKTIPETLALQSGPDY